MKIAFFAVAAVALLGGCALRAHHVLNRDLKALVGRDVHPIVEKLGYPRREDHVMGTKIYTWDDSDCILQVAVDTNDHVLNFNYHGSRRECGNLADDLD